jgi:serine protease Do
MPATVVLKVDGKDVTPDQTLSFIVANIEPGMRIHLEIVRDGQRRTLPVLGGTPASRDELAGASSSIPVGLTHGAARPGQQEHAAALSLGLQSSRYPADRRAARVEAGTQGLVVTDVDPNSDAGAKGSPRAR